MKKLFVLLFSFLLVAFLATKNSDLSAQTLSTTVFSHNNTVIVWTVSYVGFPPSTTLRMRYGLNSNDWSSLTSTISGTGTINISSNGNISPGTRIAYKAVVFSPAVTSSVDTVIMDACAFVPTISGPASACATNTISLIASPSGGTAYQWNLNGNPVSGATSETYILSASGTYTATVTSGGCTTSSVGFNFTVNANPTFNFSPVLSFCVGSSTTVGVGSTFASYLWSTGATAQTISISPNSSNRFIISSSLEKDNC